MSRPKITENVVVNEKGAFTVPEIAVYLNLNKQTVVDAVKNKKLKQSVCSYYGRVKMSTASDIRSWRSHLAKPKVQHVFHGTNKKGKNK